MKLTAQEKQAIYNYAYSNQRTDFLFENDNATIKSVADLHGVFFVKTEKENKRITDIAIVARMIFGKLSFAY